MTAHEICFDFYYRPKPSQTKKNSSTAAADARLPTLEHIGILLYTQSTCDKHFDSECTSKKK